jgi:outer membrane protein assembly factor BamB
MRAFPRIALSLLAVALLILDPARLWADDWPQWLGPQRDGVWRETGLLDRFPKDGPKVLWRTPIGLGYAGPAVAAGKVYVADFVPDEAKKLPASGFTKQKLEGKERILCLAEKTGEVLWKHEYPCTYEIGYPGGPRATPTVAGDKVYTLGTMGDIFCLDAATGKVVWSKHTVKDYGGKLGIWGASAAPLVHGNKVIYLVGGKDAVAVAFDKDTGKELWKALSADQPGYCPPMLFEIDGTKELIIWHPEAVNGLNPETGDVYWSQPFKLRAPPCMSISTPRLEHNRLFVTAFYDGSLMLEVHGGTKPSAKVLWQRKGKNEMPDNTEALQSIISTPFFKDGHVYGVCSYGELRCLKADNGDRVWSTLKATTKNDEPTRWGNAFLVAQADRFFLFNELGDLIMARMTPKGYDEIDRAHILVPTNTLAGRKVVWSHPAFANRCCFARNDKEIVCISLAAEK